MNFRQRFGDADDQPQDLNAAQGGAWQRLRSQADDLLAAADESLDRVLSTDSQAFLEAGRQTNAQ